MAVSVLRRYTPPTCTLEIMAKRSPLSQWMNRTVLNNVRFRLAFDGPHLPAEQHVRVQGDRHQLEILCDVVDAYVQQMLTQSTAQFNSSVFQASPEPEDDSSVIPIHAKRRPSPLPHTQLEPGRSLVPPEVIMEPHHPAPSMPEASSVNQAGGLGIVIPSGLALLPGGLLTHRLWLGSLATDDSGTSKTLSTTELFDLANALDEYKGEHLAMPDLQEKGWFRSTPPWMKAVAVVVFAVGMTTAVTEMLQQSNSGIRDVESADTQQAQQQDERASIERLDNAELADPSQARSRADRVRQIPDGNGLALEAAPEGENPGAAADADADANAEADTSPNGTGNQTNADGAVAEGDRTIPPELAALPPVTERQRAPEESAEEGDEQAGMLDDEAIAPAPSAASPAVPSSTNQRSAADSQFSADIVPETASESERATAAPSTPTSLPQVNEIRAYFQQSWQPPEDLDRAVEYRLVLNSDGSLAQVDPLGSTARLYASQANMPAIGTPFVSPLEAEGVMPKVRLVLQPNGSVRAFLESWN